MSLPEVLSIAFGVARGSRFLTSSTRSILCYKYLPSQPDRTALLASPLTSLSLPQYLEPGSGCSSCHLCSLDETRVRPFPTLASFIKVSILQSKAGTRLLTCSGIPWLHSCYPHSRDSAMKNDSLGNLPQAPSRLVLNLPFSPFALLTMSLKKGFVWYMLTLVSARFCS